jgi:hypothetical protein
MNIREAIEVIKIVKPYADRFTRTEDPRQVLKMLLDGIAEDAPVDAFRLVALMEHVTVDEVVEEYGEKHGIELVATIAEGLNRNEFALLVDAAWMLGMSAHRWEIGDGR